MMTMTTEVRKRVIASVVVYLVLVAVLAYLLLGPMSGESTGTKAFAAIVLLLGLGSLVMVPLWRGHSRLADTGWYEDVDGDGELDRVDLTDIAMTVVEAAKELTEDDDR